jgi:hypothetical protein
MKPPSVYELTSPSNHKTNSTTNTVQSMLISFFEENYRCRRFSSRRQQSIGAWHRSHHQVKAVHERNSRGMRAPVGSNLVRRANYGQSRAKIRLPLDWRTWSYELWFRRRKKVGDSVQSSLSVSSVDQPLNSVRCTVKE